MWVSVLKYHDRYFNQGVYFDLEIANLYYKESAFLTTNYLFILQYFFPILNIQIYIL